MSANAESVQEQMDEELTAPELSLRVDSPQKYVDENLVKILKTIFANNNPDSLIELVPGLVGVVTIENFKGMDPEVFKDYIINNEINSTDISTSRGSPFRKKEVLLPRDTGASFFKLRESCEQMKITLKFHVDVPNETDSSSECIMCYFDMHFDALRLTQERVSALLKNNPGLLNYEQNAPKESYSIV